MNQSDIRGLVRYTTRTRADIDILRRQPGFLRAVNPANIPACRMGWLSMAAIVPASENLTGLHLLTHLPLATVFWAAFFMPESLPRSEFGPPSQPEVEVKLMQWNQ